MITADAIVVASSATRALLEDMLNVPRGYERIEQAIQCAHNHVQMAAVSRTAALNLYRRWLRAISRFPERKLRGKLRFVVAHCSNATIPATRSPSELI